jgi:carbon-monoxide dehydrogenase medium subunit
MTRAELHPAGSVAEAVQLLQHYGEDAQPLAGGTSLMLLARLGLLGAEHLVDLHGIATLRGIERTDSGAVRIGALCTLREIENSAPVRTAVPALAAAVHEVATVRIRNQATIGGNLAHADPAQDPPPMLLALGAQVHATGPDGARAIAIDELFAGLFETTLRPAEVLTGVEVPALPAGWRAGYLKFLAGSEDDYATVSVAVAAQVAEGRCEQLRVGLGGLAGRAVRARSVEAALAGQPVDAAALAEAAELVRADIDPITDHRGSAQYKARVAVTCVRRQLGRVLLGDDAR